MSFENYKERKLDVLTLDGAARDYARDFHRNTFYSQSGMAAAGKDWMLRCLTGMSFKDEFDYVVAKVRAYVNDERDFNTTVKDLFTPRSQEVLEQELEQRLAILPDGTHIPGKIGSVKIGGRLIGKHEIEVEAPWSIQRRRTLGLDSSYRETIMRMAKYVWPIYAGEGDERAANSGVADALPFGTPGLALGATNTRVSNESVLLGVNALVDNLDEGTLGAVVEGRSGAQPTDPDTAVSGTLLFAVNRTASSVTFGAASDAAPGGLKTANAIADEASAAATGTLGYCRASSANTIDTPLDDHIDGEAGTSGADFNFNTLAITSGSTVSLTAWTITMPET